MSGVTDSVCVRVALKEAIALRKRAARKEKRLFLVEGIRELRAALRFKWQMEVLFCCESLYSGELNAELKDLRCPIYKISARDFARLAYREDSGGWVGVLQMRSQALSRLRLSSRPLVLVLDNIEKPGNVGAILRMAAAAGVDTLLLCGKESDPYNPNVVRNSLGALFMVPWVQISIPEAQSWIQQQGLQLLGLDPAGESLYSEMNLRKGTALVLGAEAEGLQSLWRSSCSQLIALPMQPGPIDSLNVASTAAIITYEALRQRSI